MVKYCKEFCRTLSGVFIHTRIWGTITTPATVDRTEAIKHAIEIANKNDIIVLAGKGHETYQEINGEKYPYDEREIIKKIIG